MSNKIVPPIYRAIIDDVIQAIKPEFDEYGISEDVLAELHHKWQTKVMQSNAAEFETPAPAPQVPQHPYPPPHTLHMMQPPHYTTQFLHHPGGQPQVKTEPVDSRYILNSSQYAVPSLPGPQIAGVRPAQPQPGMMAFPPSAPPAGARPGYPPALQGPAGGQQQPQAQSSQSPAPQRIPQTDGPSSSSSDSPSPPPSVAPRSTHPSLPTMPSASQSTTNDDDEAINSDLDDSDTEEEDENDEGGAGDTDIVFCTYDKVARVKTKWKCILKDGIAHVNGKDYLFAKCTGEFEW
ncbi:transcription factor IIA, alpha/beta subunit [Heliocybe sulcata]|uniref:Transcription factor IIA, alpha/beta subunit n=1 Tax=Heliocybe sulcata TaxID=5364 RepID=A0A5C3N8A4_9AGAM|nr:transcription factor IIA, alpha/beta subunit [Heliocybe sulcata]